jgi:hypothetical protein
MAGQFGLRLRIPRKSQGSFTCRKSAIWDRRLYFCCGFFRPGSNPRSWVPESSMLTTRPPKPLSVCTSSRRYPACNAHATYCHLWPVPLCSFSTLFRKRKKEKEKEIYWTLNVCFKFLYNCCPKDFSFTEELSEIWSKTFFGLHVKYPLFCPIVMRLTFSRHIFEKSSNIAFHENPSSGSRVYPCGRTWRR